MGRANPSVRLPAGVRDLLPQAAARRRAIAGALGRVFELWGYERIITPVVEVAEVLDRGLGEAGRSAALRFVEPYTGEVVALRPDITPQIARIAATRIAEASCPVRLCYEGSVTRLDHRAGGQNEVLQAGIELIDAPSPDGDAEALAVAASALEATGLRETRIDIGHVAFSRFALERCRPERRAELRAALTRKDRAATRALAAEMPRSARAVVEALPTLFGDRRGVEKRARALRLPAALGRALDEIAEVLELTRGQVADEVHRRITVDLGEVRGFDYYTGIRFRGFADGVGYAVLRGGRYDELVGQYGRDATATGFAIEVEAVAEAQDVLGVPAPAGDLGVCIAAPLRQRGAALKLASELRARGVRAAAQIVPRGSQASVEGAQAAGWTHVMVMKAGGRGAGYSPGSDQPRWFSRPAARALVAWMRGD